MTQHLAPLHSSTPTHHQGPSPPVVDSEASGAPAITCKPIAMQSSCSKPMLYCSCGSWVRKLTWQPMELPVVYLWLFRSRSLRPQEFTPSRRPQATGNGSSWRSPFVPSGSARVRSPSYPLCGPLQGARPVWSMPPASGGRSLRAHLGQQRRGRPGFGQRPDMPWCFRSALRRCLNMILG